MFKVCQGDRVKTRLWLVHGGLSRYNNALLSKMDKGTSEITLSSFSTGHTASANASQKELRFALVSSLDKRDNILITKQPRRFYYTAEDRE